MNATGTATITVTEEDFRYLHVSSTLWAANYQKEGERDVYAWESQVQEGRFRPEGEGDPARQYAIAYFFEDRCSLIMARSWLETNGHEHAIFSDEGAGGWMILTDYADVYAQKMVAR